MVEIGTWKQTACLTVTEQTASVATSELPWSGMRTPHRRTLGCVCVHVCRYQLCPFRTKASGGRIKGQPWLRPLRLCVLSLSPASSPPL